MSFAELTAHHGMIQEMMKLPTRLVYGCYPDVVCNPGSEREILNNLTESYLYKDVLVWERIKRPDKIVRLLQALAYQVGSEVSTNELSRMVELDRATVEKYINLLEQALDGGEADPQPGFPDSLPWRYRGHERRHPDQRLHQPCREGQRPSAAGKRCQ